MAALYARNRLGLSVCPGVLAGALAAVIAMAGGGCAETAPEAPVVAIPAPGPAVICDCELRSWIVTGWARHLVLVIDCPDGYQEFDGAVEFTTEANRGDYDERRDGSGALLAPRVARMTRGWVLRPFVSDPDERVEASWEITFEEARQLQADRVWKTPYVLIGTNSNSAMRSVLESVGLTLPDRVLDGGGVFGEFPGINQELGVLIDPE